MQNDTFNKMGIEKLLTYLGDPDRNQAELEVGLAYLRQSPGYEEKVERFVQAVIAPEPAPQPSPGGVLWAQIGMIIARWQQNADALIMEWADNLGPPRQVPARVNMLRGPKSTRSMVWEIPVQAATAAEDEGYHLRFELKEKSDDTTHGTLMVDVQLPGREPVDQAGTTVILKRVEEELAIQITDHFGKVSYPNIAIAELPELTLAITLPDIDT